jgi:coatomer subunit beta'
MANLYNGHILIYNINDGVCARTAPAWPPNVLHGSFLFRHHLQTLVKSFEITEQPVRAARFVARKQWLLTGVADA